jgi:hypothetical protein
MRIIALLAAAAVASPAFAQPLPDLPTTREGNYALAQRFANCSARHVGVAMVQDAADATEDFLGGRGQEAGMGLGVRREGPG